MCKNAKLNNVALFSRSPVFVSHNDIDFFLISGTDLQICTIENYLCFKSILKLSILCGASCLVFQFLTNMYFRIKFWLSWFSKWRKFDYVWNTFVTDILSLLHVLFDNFISSVNLGIEWIMSYHLPPIDMDLS